MHSISYKDKIKAFDANEELQEKIKYLAEVMDNNCIIHEGTAKNIYHLLQYNPSYLKSKIAEYSEDIKNPDNLINLAKYDSREGCWYYMYDARYLTNNQAIKIITGYLDKKHTEDLLD